MSSPDSEPLSLFGGSKGISLRKVSYSMLAEYVRCPLRYKYMYIDGKTEKFTKFYYRLGGAVHSVLADYMRKPEDNRNLETLHQLLRRKWKPEWFTDPRQEGDWFQSARTMLVNFHSSLSHKTKLISLEMPFKARIDDFLFQGRVDRIDQHPNGEYEIIDYKIGREKQEEDSFTTNTRLQPALYYHGVVQQCRVRPALFTYLLLLPNKRLSIRFDESDLHTATEEIIRLAKAMTEQGDFLPQRNTYCQDCPFQCPLADSFAARRKHE